MLDRDPALDTDSALDREDPTGRISHASTKVDSTTAGRYQECPDPTSSGMLGVLLTDLHSVKKNQCVESLFSKENNNNFVTTT